MRKDRQLSSACSALAGGNILLFWTHLDRLPPADSRYQLDSDLCLLITSSFYPIFILFSGSQSHRASPEIRLIYTKYIKEANFMRGGAPESAWFIVGEFDFTLGILRTQAQNELHF